MRLDSNGFGRCGGEVAWIGRLLFLVAGLWLIAGCGDPAVSGYAKPGDAALADSAGSSDVAVAPGKMLLSIAIVPSDVALAPGDNVRLSAIASWSDGSTVDVTARADWSSSDPSVAMASAGGQVTAVHAGQATVTASASDLGSATTIVTVSDAKVDRLAIAPASVSLAVGQSETLKAWATLSDGITRDVSAMATWVSDHNGIATVSAGRVTAEAQGTTTVTARYGVGTAQATVHVTDEPLRAITVSPSTTSVEVGAMVQLRATGSYAKGPARDITSEVLWSTSNSSIGTVAANGVFRAVAEGTVTVTATSEGLFATTTFTVTSPRVTALTIAPSNLSLAPGDAVALRATASLSNGTTLDVSSGASWSVANPAIAVVDSVGKVVAIAGGSTTVTASYRGQAATASVSVTVSAATVTRVTVSPKAATVAVGAAIELSAVAQESGGGARDVTPSGQWSSSAPSIASVDRGRVTGLGAGSATITVSYKGKSDSAAISVTAAVSTGQAALSLSVGAAYDFGMVPMGQATLYTVTVTNTGTGPATLGTVTTAGLGLAPPFALAGGTCVTGATLAAGASCTMVLSVTPSALADYKTTALLSFGASASVPLALAASAIPAYVRVSAGAMHTCAVFSDGRIKCWGYNGGGQLGLGDTTNRGDASDPGHHMGTALPFVGLGAGQKVVSVHAGGGHACALLESGKVKCWGSNDVGQLGVGDTTTRGDSSDPGHGMGDSLPNVNLGSGLTAKQVAVGGSHSCALLDNGQVKCWGVNWSGQLGVGDTTSRGDSLEPGHGMGDELPAVDLGPGRTARQLAVGNGFSCALLDTFQVKCWGSNDNGQLGLGDVVYRGDSNDPGHSMAQLTTVDLGAGRTAKSVSTGPVPLHVCAILDTDDVKCWGTNSSGQLGLGDTTNRGDSADPGHAMGDLLGVVDLGSGRKATEVRTGDQHTCAQLDNGTVKCWGRNYFGGSLGLGDTEFRGDSSNPGHQMGDLLPAVALGAGYTVVGLAVGSDHGCALLADGTVKCWGYNGEGELGLGDIANRGDSTDPGHEMGNGLPAVDLGASAIAWGMGASYDCGRVALGQTVQHTLVVENRGTASAVLGAVSTEGLGVTAPFAVAGGTCVAGGTMAPGASCTVVISVRPNSAGDFTASARLAFSGGLLDAAVLSLRASSGAEFPGPGSVVLAAGEDHVCALFGGFVKCWGRNNEGQLGVGDVISRGDSTARGHQMEDLATVDLGTGQRAVSIHAGYGHTCALLATGKVKCWGLNEDGELGLGDTINRGDSEEPGHRLGDDLPTVDLGPGRTAKLLATGRRQTCVIFDDGAVKCWGRNHYGQLGIGDTTSRGNSLDPGHGLGSALPVVDLGTGRTAKQLALGDYSVCALLDTDQVKCWGRNSFGQLGLGDTTNRGDDSGDPAHAMGDLLPTVDLGGQRYVKSLGGSGASADHMCAILDTDELKCWGSNSSGQLGLGDAVSRGDVPGQTGDSLASVSLGLGRKVTHLARGDRHTCALLDDQWIKCWGVNTYGPLGLGDTTNRGDSQAAGHEMGDTLVPIPLGTGRTARHVVAGGYYTCAMFVDGAVKCWGSGSRLGLGDSVNRGDDPNEMGDFLPAVDLGPAGAKLSPIGGAATFDFGWIPLSQPTRRTITLFNRSRATPAVLGTVSAAGLGLTSPVELSAGTCTSGASIDPGRSCTLELSITPSAATPYSGAVRVSYAGGTDTELVLSVLASPGGPVFAPLAPSRITVGAHHSCVGRVDGSVKCWGYNAYGALGLGDAVSRGDSANAGHQMGAALPAVDLGQGQKAASVHGGGGASWGGGHTCVVLETGHVKCWGRNDSWQLGLGDSSNRGDSQDPGHLMGDNLATVTLGTGRTAVQLATGEADTCALLDDGQVKCWGYTNYNPLGSGGYRGLIGLGTWREGKQLAAGYDFACALLDTHQVKCWGSNAYGQLGLGDSVTRLDGQPGSGLGDALPAVDLGSQRYVKALSVGGGAGSHMCAILDNDQIKCWGYNGSGQLGLGDTTNRGDQPNQMGDLLPQVDLGPGRSARAVTVGYQHTCALLDDASIKCWGSNSNGGELGLGDAINRGDQAGQMGAALPAVSLGSNRSALALASSGWHTCAMLDNGDIKCWGNNSAGQLGLGDTTNRGEANNQMGDLLPAVDLGP